MKSPARYIADFVVAGNNILDASVTLADLGTDVLANIASAGANIAGLTTSNIAEGSNLYYTDERVYANINPLLANLDVGANLSASNTDALAEGTTNLYFSNDRVYANVSPLLFSGEYSDLANTPTIPSLVGYATESYVDNAIANVETFSGEYSDLANVPVIPTATGNLINDSGFITTDSLTTSNVTEGSNLYYTDERVYANISPLLANLDVGANLSTSNTDALAEGTTNLYFSNDRVYANVAPLLDGIVAGNVDLSAVYANINNLSNSINVLFAFNDQTDIDGGVFEGDIDGGDWQYDPNAVDLDAGTY